MKGLRVRLLVIGLGLAAFVTACGHSEGTPRPVIKPAEVIATATVRAGGVPGGAPPAPFSDSSPAGQLFGTHCAACHTVKAGGGTTGPNLSTIGTTGATRKPGQDAAAYIKESITAPNALVVQGYAQGVMPPDFGQKLTPAQLDQLVNYLLEQK